MIVAIISSGSVTNCKEIIEKTLKDIPVIEIVSGVSSDVDAVVKRYAEERHIAYRKFLPNCRKYGYYAFLKRETQMIKYADMVLVVWDGFSEETEYIIQKALKLGKIVVAKKM